jgi:hypothetical protein
LVIVPLDNYRPIMPLHINGFGRRIMVMVMNPMLVVAIGMTAFAALIFPSVRKGCTSTQYGRKSRNYKYFQDLTFHCVLLFPLKLPRLDGAGPRGVYFGFSARGGGLGSHLI